MLTNFLKIALRKFIRNRVFTVLNITGLSAGITCFILIALLIHYELSFDSFHEKRNSIFRVYKLDKSTDGIVKSATTPDPLPRALKNDFRELDHVVRFTGQRMDISVENRKFELNLMTCDEDVFKVFTFPFQYGNSDHAMDDPYNVVLSHETATKLFGNENPVGKTLTVMNNTEFSVSGVLKKIPSNSNLQFDLLVPVRFRQMIDPEFEDRWHSSGTYTFIHCTDENYLSYVEKNLDGFLEKYQPDWLDGRSQLAIEQLTDIHVTTQSANEMVSTVSSNYLILLVVIGCSILLIACFNYTILMISSYSERMKEIGVRKIMGANRKKLILQFLGETVLVTLIATIIGVILTELFVPKFSELVERQIGFPVVNMPVYITVTIGFGLIVGLLSGLYPAIYLSSLSSINLIKKTVASIPRRKFVLSNVLLTVQFSITATLIISMLIIYAQIYFMKNHDLGFNPENVLAFPTRYNELENPDEKIETWKNHMIQNGKLHGIQAVSVSEHIPGYYFNNAFGVMKSTADHEDFEVMIVTSVDEKYADIYQADLKSGRFFSDEIENDKYGAVMINETAAGVLAFDDPIGQVIKFRHGEGPFTIIGVVKNIHFRSLQHQIEPVIYRYASSWKSQFFAVKIDPELKEEALYFLDDANELFGNGNHLDYFYVVDKYGSSYQSEINVLEIISLFTGLAILLSCLGLFGLIGISITQRLKEIGIRKVLGASLTQIFHLLTTTYIRPVLLASIIAWPVSYYLIAKWLQSYPYRISVGFHWMLLGSLLILFIALSVIFYHIFMAARNNPVHALRDE